MFGLPRILMVYAVAIPLALVLGYAVSSGLSTPEDSTNLLMVGLLLFVLALPILFKWHHIMLIFLWNAAFLFPFLPGQPQAWLLMAVLSFGISWLNGLLGGGKFVRVPELARPLVFLGFVVFATGVIRGGIGARVFGSTSYGGRAYFYILGPIIGYFALTAMRIPLAKANRTTAIYLLSGMTFVLSNLVFFLGPSFYFAYNILPASFMQGQAQVELGMEPTAFERLNGFTPGCTALVGYFLMRWGIRGIFSYAHPWRVVLLFVTFLLSLLGGFRGSVIMLGLLFFCQFCAERLWRTHFLPISMGFAVLAAMTVFLFAGRLPLAAQRAVSFLPVQVDPEVRLDAENSVEWRVQMWRMLVPKIPEYLLVGKGYSIDPEELYFAVLGGGAEEASGNAELVAGDYHSGPLSTIIPLGLWGVVGFFWLLGAGTKALYRNYRYGDPALLHINSFFLAMFITQAIVFFTVFGAFNSQLYMFTGILGMSVALNGGVSKPGQIVARAAGSDIIQAPVSILV